MASTKQHSKKEPRLFKRDLKFMDIYYVTDDFVREKSLDKKTRHEVMVRIHDFSIHLADTFSLYTASKKPTEKTYHQIETGLKEVVRRAKISLALNKKHVKYFVDYWPSLAGVLQRDAHLLKDQRLQGIIEGFEKRTHEIKK